MARTKHADKNNPPVPAKRGRPPKGQTKPEKVKKPTKAEKKAPGANKNHNFNSPMNVDEQKLFLQHLPIIVAQKDKVTTAVADLRNLYKKAKGDGFEKADFDLAQAIDTAEKEAKLKARIARQLTIAKYCGKSLGAQLDLFQQPDRTPSSEIAYDEGKIASMKNQVADPGYDPSTEQYREYMRGYHDVQGEQIKGGITKPNPAPEPPKAIPDPRNAPISGMGMSRADYHREQELARLAAEKSGTAAAAPEPISAFRKKAASPA
jgi:hypothetical protein